MYLNKYYKFAGFVVLALMLGGVLAVAVSEVHSFDVFWQLQSGRYMWENGSFIRTDLFTLKPDSPRYEHSWLHDLILFWTYQIAGYGGISVLKGVLVFATGAILVLVAKIRESSWAATALVFPVFMFTSGGWLERPQLWTFLLFALFVLVLEVACRRRSWLILWVFPLAVMWANLHAGSVLAIALTGAYLVGNFADGIIRKSFDRGLMIKLASALGLICTAAFATPYPEKLLNTLLFSTKLGAKVDASGKITGRSVAVFNMDWTPTTFQTEPTFFYALGVVVVIMLLGWRRLNLADVCLLAGLTLMGMKLVRHIPFFYMGALAIIPAYLDAAARPVIDRMPSPARILGWVVCLVCALWMFWIAGQPLYKTYGSFNRGLRTWHYPIEAAEFIDQHKLAANLYNTYDWGGYLAWKLFPDYSVFWDGRQTSKKMFDLGWTVMAGKPEWQEILDTFDVKTIVTRASTIDTGQRYPLLDRLRKSENWFLVFNDESSMIFVKRGSMPEAWMQKHVRPKRMMDDTILAEALLMVKVNPKRYMAWWEMSQIFLKRKDYKGALVTIRQHIARSPRPHPQALKIRDQLEQHLKKVSQQKQQSQK